MHNVIDINFVQILFYNEKKIKREKNKVLRFDLDNVTSIYGILGVSLLGVYLGTSK